MPDDLTFITDTDLIAELARRYDTLVIAGVKDRTELQEERLAFTAGNDLAAIGLLHRMERAMHWSMDEAEDEGE